MSNFNMNRLIPGVDISWGDIRGDISKQSDLMSMMSSYATKTWVSCKNYLTASNLKTINYQSIVGEGNINIEASVPDYYATKAWVSEQGYLTSVPSKYATKYWVSDQGYIKSDALSGYATESWVSSQGYLTSVPSEFATQSWVSEQGYITTSALSGYATQSWVSDQGYLTSVPDYFATKSWVSDQGYLTSETLPSDLATESWVVSQGYITTSALSDYATKSWVSDQGYIRINALYSYATKAWVSDQDYATLEDCFVNTTTSKTGSKFTSVVSGVPYDKNLYFVAYNENLERDELYIWKNNTWNYFDGSTLTPKTFTVTPNSANNIFRTNDNGYIMTWLVPDNQGEILYGVDNGDDNGFDFNQYTEAYAIEPMLTWSCGPYLRFQGTHKLEQVGDGIYAWTQDNIPNWPNANYVKSVLNGTDVYLFMQVFNMNTGMWEYNVYTYVESTKTLTFIGNYLSDSHNNMFAFDGDVYFEFNSTVYKIDLTKVGTQDPIYVETDIFCSNSQYFCGGVNDVLYTVNYDIAFHLGYVWGENSSAPVVPVSNGTYVLKAVRTSSGVTYSWEIDEVAQAVQITNNILS